MWRSPSSTLESADRVVVPLVVLHLHRVPRASIDEHAADGHSAGGAMQLCVHEHAVVLSRNSPPPGAPSLPDEITQWLVGFGLEAEQKPDGSAHHTGLRLLPCLGQLFQAPIFVLGKQNLDSRHAVV
jgi:hypothetical protein